MRDPSVDARVAQVLAECSNKSASLEIVYSAWVAPLTGISHRGGTRSFDGGAYYADGKSCERSLHVKHGLPNIPIAIDVDQDKPLIEGLHLYGGLLKNEHFGHFLAESLARLWAVPILGNNIKSIVFFVRDRALPIPRYITETLDILCPNIDLTIVTEPTRFERLAIPDQLAHPVIGFVYGHPAIRDFLARADITPSYKGEKVYLSRTRLRGSDGEILNEIILEENLRREGYQIVYPEILSIREQMEIYAGADILIFAEGSAFHLYALACRRNQKVFMIRRRGGIVFDWQILSFGGPVIDSPLCVRAYLIPQQDGLSLIRARIILDFEEIRHAMMSLGYASGQSWHIPSTEEIELEKTRVQEATGLVFIEHHNFENSASFSLEMSAGRQAARN